ncbi:MAG: hypothetical protein ACREOS_12960, partial [Candidatus Dormibacteraceae bacterium]
ERVRGYLMSVEIDLHRHFTNVEELRQFLRRQPSSDDLKRRRKLFNETLALREAIGRVDLSVEELLKEEDD